MHYICLVGGTRYGGQGSLHELHTSVTPVRLPMLNSNPADSDKICEPVLRPVLGLSETWRHVLLCLVTESQKTVTHTVLLLMIPCVREYSMDDDLRGKCSTVQLRSSCVVSGSWIRVFKVLQSTATS